LTICEENAININGPHESGLKQIATYAAQLVCIGSKFPVGVCLAAKFDDIRDGLTLFYVRLVWTLHGTQL
jgi:hypothetical protein